MMYAPFGGGSPMSCYTRTGEIGWTDMCTEGVCTVVTCALADSYKHMYVTRSVDLRLHGVVNIWLQLIRYETYSTSSIIPLFPSTPRPLPHPVPSHSIPFLLSSPSISLPLATPLLTHPTPSCHALPCPSHTLLSHLSLPIPHPPAMPLLTHSAPSCHTPPHLLTLEPKLWPHS